MNWPINQICVERCEECAGGEEVGFCRFALADYHHDDDDDFDDHDDDDDTLQGRVKTSG